MIIIHVVNHRHHYQYYQQRPYELSALQTQHYHYYQGISSVFIINTMNEGDFHSPGYTYTTSHLSLLFQILGDV